MTIQEQRILRSLHDKMRSDCALLVDGTDVDIERDDGSITRQHVPGLLRQLASAIGNSNERLGYVRSKDGRPIVISVQAFDLMTGIERITRLWNRDQDIAVRISRTVAALCTRSTDAIPDAHSIARHLATWVRLINELFEPPRRLHLAAACPECGKATVTRMDGGERVIGPALQISRVANGHQCECMACGARWPDSHFLLLSQVLGCESIV
jgi:hypothetical protein